MTPDDIKNLRQRLGLSQQGLADAINAQNPLLRSDRNIVSRWERGSNTPNVHYLAVLESLAGRVQSACPKSLWTEGHNGP